MVHRLRRAVCVALLVAQLGFASAQAQIVASPTAPPEQRPQVTTAPNGVPLVNIQAPSAAGVSRNVYSQFDVQARGAILNNSAADARTQLSGWVPGNASLAGSGPARVILNEVRSSHPSQLRGPIEVAGSRAEVVIANPSGIVVNGGGFINASRATLTTGEPQFNAQGGLEGYRVRGGRVRIEGEGLDASSTDYAAILARAVEVNAGLWAKHLQIVAGAHQASADHERITPETANEPAPAFALDVAALGGMYAGKIHLIGNEAGLGMRNAGHLGAGPGELIVTAEGRIENRGTMEAARLQIAAGGDIRNLGT
ncbi:MAG: filamentous hemagglutinin N-terminal domain-containing protein, partial [Variovorax sp.]